MRIELNDAYSQWHTDPTYEHYELFGKVLLRFVSGCVRQRYAMQEDLREDIIANSIIRILERLKDFDATRAPFEVWAYKKIEDVRAEQLKEISERREYPILETDPAPDKFKGLDAKILLKQLMKTLSVDEQRLVNLQLEGMEDEEIALELGIPVGTVWSRWNRIKEKMRKSGE